MLLTAHALVSVLCSVLSVALVLHEGPRQRAARALGTAFGAWSYLMAYSGVTLLFRPDPGPGQAVFEGHFLVVETLGLVGLLRFTSMFPRPLDHSELAPSPTLPPVLKPFHALSVVMRRDGAPWLAGVVTLAGLWTWTWLRGDSISDAGLSPLMDVVRFAAVGLVVMNLRAAWAAATEGDRDRLTWLIAALVFLLGSLAILIGGNVLVAVTGFPEPDVAWRPLVLDVGLVGFLSGLAMSVLYHGRMHPTDATRRLAVGSGIITVGLFFAAGLEAFFAGGMLASYSPRSGVGTAVAFATMLSTHRAMTRFLDRLLPRP
jgi:hypothetical protein